MNKRFLMLIAAGSLAFTVMPAASARPFYVEMDNPAAFGYHISARAEGTNVHITIDLDARASKAFGDARVQFAPEDPDQTPKNPEIKVLVRQTADKRKQLVLTIPKRFLADYILRVNSAPLREKDFLPNFCGYQVPLDNALK